LVVSEQPCKEAHTRFAIHVITQITRVATIKRQTRAAYGC